jgi:lipid II isoglutaminyl synthase (glutamine-hydrolysing)
MLTTPNKLKIAYFYPDLLNLYGDTGNVEILAYRANKRNIHVDVLNININTKIDADIMNHVNLVFMGGGPDASQKELYTDLLTVKGLYLKDYIEQGKTGLYICGAYQLLGHYYKASDGSEIEGLGVFDLYTHSAGPDVPRCIGNTVAALSDAITTDAVFKRINNVDNKIVGFENHGGRTYLQGDSTPLAHIELGYGNNAQDHTEGIYYKNSIGTYFHGPFLARNPHMADLLIAKALNLFDLSELDDKLMIAAHTASQLFKQ